MTPPTDELAESHGCKICYKHFANNPIYKCKNGDNICYKCRRNRIVCPICKGNFTGERNRKLEKICVESLGLEKEVPEKVFGPKNLKHDLFSGPVQGPGNFQCQVPKCKIKLPISRIVNHCRWNHKSLYIECPKEQCFQYYSHSFTAPMEDFTKIYQLASYGLIYLCFVVTKKNGTFIINGWAQLAAPKEFTKKIRYNLKVDISQISYSFSDIPHSVRHSKETIMTNGQYLTATSERNEIMQINLNVRKNKGSKMHKNTTTHTKFPRGFARVPI